jgi:hypothetical protein
MNQTGVASTGLRRQAFRNRDSCTSVSDGNAQQLSRQRDELLEPERLVSELRAECVNLGGLRFIEIVVAGDNGDRRVGQSGNRADRAKKLQPAGEWHTEVQDHRVRAVRLCQRETFVRGQSGPHFVSLQTKHSRERIGNADVVIDDEHTSSGGAGVGGHAAIVGPTAGVVKRAKRSTPLITATIAAFVLYSGRFYAAFRAGRHSYVLSPEVVLSPILVRPVREQLEHDRVIRLLQAKYKRKFEVAINPGSEQTAPVGGPPPWYPDLVLQSNEKARKLLGVVEVETTESVNHLEAMSQWAAFSRLHVPFHLYVPVGCIDSARRLCTDLQIPAAEVWAYHAIGDQMRFTLVQKAPQPVDGKRAAAPAATPPAKPASPARKSAPRGRATAIPARPARRAAAPAPASRRKSASGKAKAAPPARSAAKSARKPVSGPARTSKRR